MRLHCGQKCSSTGAPAPQLRHSRMESERTGIGSGVMVKLAARSRQACVIFFRRLTACRRPPACCYGLSCAEGAAAAAGRLRVRVVENEALGQQRGVVIESRPLEEEQALLVDEDFRAVRSVEHLVAQTRLAFPRKGVAQARTAATLHAHTKTPIADALLGHQRSDLPRCPFANLDHFVPSG